LALSLVGYLIVPIGAVAGNPGNAIVRVFVVFYCTCVFIWYLHFCGVVFLFICLVPLEAKDQAGLQVRMQIIRTMLTIVISSVCTCRYRILRLSHHFAFFLSTFTWGLIYMYMYN